VVDIIMVMGAGIGVIEDVAAGTEATGDVVAEIAVMETEAAVEIKLDTYLLSIAIKPKNTCSVA
jgi:hypothetical protein